MNFKTNNDQDGFNSYISRDEFFNAASNINTPPPPPPPLNDCPCQYAVSGCTNPSANNFNGNATIDDGSCTFSSTCYELGCVSQGVPLPGINYNNLTSPGCNSLGSTYSNSPAPCGSLPNNSGQGKNFSGYSNFNQQGFGGYNDQMWFND